MLFQTKTGEYLNDALQPMPENQGVYLKHTSTRYINVSDDQRGELPQLYSNRSECCGCSACYSVCEKSGEKTGEIIYRFSKNNRESEILPLTGAITMLPDEEGFLYPVIDASKCIRCYRCLRVCPMKL